MASDQQLSEVLSEFARTMLTDFPIQAILDHLVQRIVDVLPITAVGVTLIAPGEKPHYIAASDDSALQFEKLQTQTGDGPCLLAYHSGVAVTVTDLRADDRFPLFTPMALAAGMVATFTFPLHNGDRRLGALDLYRDTPGPLSDHAMASAQTLADVASAYLLNAQARAALQDSSDRSRDAALHDALTGLPNRVLVLERLEHALLRRIRSHKAVAMLFVDLDRFKDVNDTYSHELGDELLIAVAHRLTSLLRPGDTLGRLSGDEFVIVCEDLDAPRHADTIGSRVTEAMSQPFLLSGIDVNMTASVGIAIAEPADHVPEDLLHDADLAMYQAKRQGGDRKQVFDLRAQHLAENQASLGRDLIGVLARHELHAVYQPIVATSDRRITGVEALLRWAHPTRGIVSPSTLIPLAEQSGSITEIGHWVLQRAWTDRNRWQDQRPGDDLTVSVNVSANQLMSPGFAASVAAVLQTADSDPSLLTLEVTESVFVRDSERALMVLGDLKDLGVKLALDDFGTGYSSLSYLKRFPLDIVKVDQTFVAELGRDSASHLIVNAVVQLAHGLGMTVVAEGVETAEQHREVTGLGCDACQGYYFARPMPAIDLDTLIHHRADGTDTHLPVLTAS